MTLGEKIKFYRKQLHITQEQLAEQLDVSTQSISNWENDLCYPTTDKIEYIAKALNVTAGVLMDDTSSSLKNWELRDEMFSSENMYQNVLQCILANKLSQSIEALPYMMKCHSNQLRNGQTDIPYCSHPLLMAWQALALGIHDDDTIATILLHGIYRNCNISPEDIPFPLTNHVQNALQLLYYQPLASETSQQAKERYYKTIMTDKLASIVRIIDQCNKISTIAIGFPKEKLYGYIEDTELYVLPLLNHVQTSYLDYYNIAFLLKYQILSVIEGLKRTI